MRFFQIVCLPFCAFLGSKFCLFKLFTPSRAVARALIGGGGGVYSYIRVMPDRFLLKSVVFKFISKEISRAEHEYMNIHHPPPPPINALAMALTPSTYVIRPQQFFTSGSLDFISYLPIFTSPRRINVKSYL